MLGVPIGLEIGIDLAVDHEHAGRAIGNPSFERIEIGELAHRNSARAKAAGDRGEIGLRKLHDVNRIALAAEIVDLGCIGGVVINQEMQSRSFSRTAVSRSAIDIRKPPSPVPSTASLPGLAMASPMTEGSPSPTD